MSPAPPPGHSPPAADDILRARAEVLARPAPDATAPRPAGGMELLEFVIGGQAYAIESRHASEVVTLDELTPVPGTPAFVLGVFNLRGRITALLDLRDFLGLPKHGLSDLGQVVLVRRPQLKFGFACDRIEGVSACAPEQVQALLAPLQNQSRHLRGLTPQGRLIIDLDTMLADPALIVNKELTS